MTRTIIQRPDLHTNIGTRTRARAEAPVARRFSRYYYFPRLRRTTDTRACIHTRIQTRYTVRDGSYISSRVFDKYLIVSLQASRLRGPSRARARVICTFDTLLKHYGTTGARVRARIPRTFRHVLFACKYTSFFFVLYRFVRSNEMSPPRVQRPLASVRLEAKGG